MNHLQFESKFMPTQSYHLNSMYQNNGYYDPSQLAPYGSAAVRCDPNSQSSELLSPNISFHEAPSFTSPSDNSYSLPAADNLSQGSAYQMSPSAAQQYQIYSQDNSYILTSQISPTSSECGLSPNRNEEQFMSQQPNDDFSLDPALVTQALSNQNINFKLGNKQFSRNDLVQLINLSEKSDNKLAIQALIKKLLANNMQNNNISSASSRSLGPTAENYAVSLITPPLSPNNDRFQNLSKVPLFDSVKPAPISSINKSVYFSPSTTSIKIEPDNQPEQNIIKPEEEPTGYGMNNQISYEIGNNVPYAGQTMMNNQSVDFGTATMPMDSSSVVLSTPSPRQTFCENGVKISPKTGKHGYKQSSLSKGRKLKNRSLDNDNQFLGGTPPKQMAKQSQKRSAHLSAEFRYRTKLNDKISKLRILVGQKVHLSKSAVLTRSIETIVKLQKHIMQLSEENGHLKSTISNMAHQTKTQSNVQNNTVVGGSSSVDYNSSKKLMPLKELKALAKSVRSPQQQQQANFELGYQKPAQNLDINNNSAGIDPSEQVLDFDKLFDQF